jgi:hypothetical protein
MVTWGDWADDVVHLDFDNTPLGEVKLWAFRACFWFKLEGFIILRSSMKHYVVKEEGMVIYEYKLGSYHVVFDRPVRWKNNVKVMNWVALLSGNSNLQSYVRMQCIKRSSTARCSEKMGKQKVKPVPRLVFRYGKQYRKVKCFLETRKFILDSLKRLKKRNEKKKRISKKETRENN